MAFSWSGAASGTQSQPTSGGKFSWSGSAPVGMAGLQPQIPVFKDVPSLNQALHAGQINKAQWQDQFKQIQAKTNGPAIQTGVLQNLNPFNKQSVVNQQQITPIKNTFVGAYQQAMNQAKYLSGPTSTQQQRSTIISNQGAAAKNPEYQKAIVGLPTKTNSVAGLVQAQKMAASGAKAPQIRTFLQKDAQALSAQTARGAVAATTIASFSVPGEGLLAKGSVALARKTGLSDALATARAGVGRDVTRGSVPHPPSAFDSHIAPTAEELPKAGQSTTTAAKTAPAASKVSTTQSVAQVEPTKVLQSKAVRSVAPTADELQMGKALGMSPEQVAKAKEQYLAPTGSVPKTRNPLPETKNPIKVSLSEPKAGDYGAAIADKQRVDSGISLAATRAQVAVKRLSSTDRNLFPHARENPALIDKAANPALMKDAVTKFGKLTDTAHAFDVASGGTTRHLPNYYRHIVDLSKPEDAARFNVLAQKKGFTVDPFSYKGLNNQPRVFSTIKQAEAAKFKVINQDPLKEIQDYANAAKGVVGKQVLGRGVQLADAARGPEAALTEKFKLGPGQYIDVSPEAAKKLRGVEMLNPSTNRAVKGLRTANQAVKSTVLSLGQFHTINIGALRAAPTLIAKGHPVAAAKGLYGMFRGAFGTKFADNVIGKAIDDGTVDKAAKIGMPYGGTGYNTEGTFLKHGIGSRTVFGKQIPIMHDQVARSIIGDLEKKGVSLDSKEARNAGLSGANMMGEINREVQNIRPSVKKAMSDWLLAGQFTPSKMLQVKRAATTRGVGGSYARANILSNVATVAAISTGIGYAFHQKSDSLRDVLLRALVNPGAPTPIKDTKGNTIQLGLPGTDTSDVAKALGITLVRNSDGHLGVSWDVHNAPGTVKDFLRNRLSPGASAGVQLATNTQFGNKPLYDPRAQAGGKAIQVGTQLVSENLPIGLQGIVFTKGVESKLPQSSQTILKSNSPGTNPVLKSVGSSFGVTPKTDPTTGKGLATALTNALFNQQKNALPQVQSSAKSLVKQGNISAANQAINKYNQQVLKIAKSGLASEGKPVPDDKTLIKQLKKSKFYYAPQQKTIAGWANKKTTKGGFGF